MGERTGRTAVTAVLVVVATTALGWLPRHLCAPYLCYTDVWTMWARRDLSEHPLPYVEGTWTAPADLGGGAVEYPVLSGTAMWLTALPVDSYLGFLLVSSVVAALLGAVVAWLLAGWVGRWAYLWSLSPFVLLYAPYNWDLYPVLTTVLGLAVVLRGPAAWSPRRRAAVAAVLFGVGCLFKLYPLIYVLPLACWLAVAVGGPLARRLRAAAGPFAVASAVVVLGNLPFALLGPEGWRGSLEFQSHRVISPDTMSIWFWWSAPFHGRWAIDGTALSVVTLVSGVVVLAVFAHAVVRGLRSAGPAFPLLNVAAAMTVAFVLLGKVSSPQYALWLLPFLVLLAVPWRLVVAYVVTDLSMFFLWFRIFDDRGAAPLLLVAVTANALVLARLYVVLLAAPPRTGGPAADVPAVRDRSAAQRTDAPRAAV